MAFDPTPYYYLSWTMGLFAGGLLGPVIMFLRRFGTIYTLQIRPGSNQFRLTHLRPKKGRIYPKDGGRGLVPLLKESTFAGPKPQKTDLNPDGTPGKELRGLRGMLNQTLILVNSESMMPMQVVGNEVREVDGRRLFAIEHDERAMQLELAAKPDDKKWVALMVLGTLALIAVVITIVVVLPKFMG